MLFIGDDWAEDHHDIELADDEGRLVARRRLHEGIEGIAGLHALVAEHLVEDYDELEPDQLQGLVKVGIETDRAPWVAALVAAGYEVFGINPMSVTRYRERHSTSGAKSDAADAHLLAEIVRLDRAHHRPLAGDSEEAEAIKLVARTHQSLVWERSRHVLRLRAALRDFFPAALRAFPDLDAPDTLELLAAAADPDRAAGLTKARIAAALRRANRRNVEARASEIRQVLRAEELRRSPAVQAAYAAIVASQASVVQALNIQIAQIGAVVEDHFGQHPDAEIYASQPGLGVVLAARVLGEFGDDPHPLHRRQGPQELRRHRPDRQGVRQEEDRAGPLRPQPQARRRAAAMGVLLAARITRRHRPTTGSSAPATSATRPPCARSPTAASASCTAA